MTPGDFEWPAPERIPFGQLVNYGYHGDVVLPFPVKSVAAAAAGSIEARVNWLICKDVCVSGKGRLAIAFPLAGDAAAAVPAWKQMIDEARARVPRSAPAAWRVEARDQGAAFSLAVTTGRREGRRHVLPARRRE